MVRLLKTYIDRDIQWLRYKYSTATGEELPQPWIDKLVEYCLDLICYSGSTLAWEDPTPMALLVSKGYSEADAANLICDFQNSVLESLENAGLNVKAELVHEIRLLANGGTCVYIRESRI